MQGALATLARRSRVRGQVTHPLSHPAMGAIIDRVGHLFLDDKVLAKPDRHLIFVCGGKVDEPPETVRANFLKYAIAEMPGYRFVLAETASSDLLEHGDPQFLNIADFEERLAEITDCILVFLRARARLPK